MAEWPLVVFTNVTALAALEAYDDLPPFLKGWFAQLLDPETLDLLRLAGDRQVDVRLSARGNKVRRRPVVSFDAGPQEMVEA